MFRGKTMLLKNDYFVKAGTVFWIGAVLAYFFQFPFSILSSLITPCLFLYIFVQIPNIRIIKDKKYIIALSIYLFFIITLVGRSVALGISLSRIIRFSLILVAIPLTCLIKDDNFSVKLKIFTNLAVIKSLILIFFGFIIVYQGSFDHFRSWVMSFGLGDIYFLNRLIPKVQVQGNALLVIAFFLDYMKNKKLTIKNLIIIAGVIMAGNFAFIIAIISFVLWRGGIYAIKFIRTNKYGKIIVIAAGLAFVAVLIPYVISKVQEKAEVSNAVRMDQIKILLNANPFIGDGLGYWINAVTDRVSYNGDMYFELQTLYIYKQIGLIGLSLFYVVTLMPIKRVGKDCFMLYLVYLFFSFWNPYCFDTTQMFTIILLINMSNLGEHNEEGSYYSLSSLRRCKG